jgi:protein SCO1/2
MYFHRSPTLHAAALSGLAALCLAGSAAASSADSRDFIPAVAPTFPASDIGVSEHLDARVPLEVSLRDHRGIPVALGELLDGELPTILTFNYSKCETLCSLQLGAFSAALGKLKWQVGKQFRVLTILIDPDEALARAQATRDRHVQPLSPEDRAGWTFALAAIPGDDAAIRAIAEAVGVRYKYLPEVREWAHPATLIFLSPKGRVTRYVHGIDYSPEVLTESITLAGLSESSTAVGFMLRCFHWDSNANNYSRFGMSVLRYGAAGFLALFVSALALWRLLRRPGGDSTGVARS